MEDPSIPSQTDQLAMFTKDDSDATAVFGGGLAGLAAGHLLTEAGRRALLFEADSDVGGLSKTIVSGSFRFDIGGHRFFTRDKEVDELVKELLGDELIEVQRKSKIYMRRKFFDYPLKPANALFGLGMSTVVKALMDYGWERVRLLSGNGSDKSLEDWVVRNFGRTMFNIYFKEYSEKVWGLDCSRISQSWVAKRIQGLSLGTAVKNAFFKFSGKGIPTLADTFLYPRLGIGRIAERFQEEISKKNGLYTDTALSKVNHDGRTINGVEVTNCKKSYEIKAENYISTIPLNALVSMMRPAPPSEVVEAALGLGYRDLVIVAVEVNREIVTDQNWIYIPEKEMLFGRLHEPKCWSPDMAPEDKTLLVVEFFCFQGDDIWNLPDKTLSETTVGGLEKLDFLSAKEVLSTKVIRVPRAYPLFEVGYEERCDKIYDYLSGFKNLAIAGRAGMFQYQNMDHAIRSGREAAEEIMRKSRA